MNLTLKEEQYISRKLILSIFNVLIPYIFLVIFFLSSVTIENMGFYELKCFIIEIFNSFLEMENTGEMIMCFIIFGLVSLIFLYGFIISPLLGILQN